MCACFNIFKLIFLSFLSFSLLAEILPRIRSESFDSRPPTGIPGGLHPILSYSIRFHRISVRHTGFLAMGF